MSGTNKIELARRILEQKLRDLILDLQVNYTSPRLVAIVRDGSRIYVRYNDHDQYTYSVVFSASEGDKCLFDNYDDRWKVTTRPHHFHSRFRTQVSASPMRGKPEEDIVLLCKLFLDGQLQSRDLRFDS